MTPLQTALRRASCKGYSLTDFASSSRSSSLNGLVYLAGLFFANVIGRKVVSWGQSLTVRIPLIGAVYGASRKFVESFSSAGCPVLLVYLAVRELFDRRSALFSSLIVALYYPLVYYAHTANVDVPYLFWALLAIYSFIRVLKQGGLKDYVLFALFGTLAICIKVHNFVLFIVFLALWHIIFSAFGL